MSNEIENDLSDWEDGAFTIPKACEFSGYGRTRMYSLINDGLVTSQKHGAKTLIAKRSLVRRLAKGSESRAPHGQATTRAA